MNNLKEIEEILHSFIFDRNHAHYVLYDKNKYRSSSIKGELVFNTFTLNEREIEMIKKYSESKTEEEIEKFINNGSNYRNKLIENCYGCNVCNLEEAKKIRKFFSEQEGFDFKLPNRLLNKKIIINDYTLHFQYIKTIDDKSSSLIDEETERYNKLTECDIVQYTKWKNLHFSCEYKETQQYNIILQYHGVYLDLCKVKIYDKNNFYYNFPENFINDKFNNERDEYHKLTIEKNCKMDKHEKEVYYSTLYKNVFVLLSLITDDVELLDDDLKIQTSYYYEATKPDDIENLMNTELDYEYFINLQTKNGIYSPSRKMIETLYDGWKVRYRKKLKKDLLKKLNIHTVQLKADSHFDLLEFFDIDGIFVKAPKKVIERYGYEKYCISEKIVEKINNEKSLQEKKQKIAEYNDTFTLIQHGKIILENKLSSDIIKHLQNKNVVDFEKDVIDEMKHIFDDFTHINYFELATFGTHYAYELAGENHFNTECKNSHIDSEDLIKIHDLYKIYEVDAKILEIKYGWIEKGANVFGIKRKGKGFELYVDDYDLDF